MIAVNETGFLPYAEKTAVSDEDGAFYVVDDNERQCTDVKVSVTDAGYDDTAGHQVYRIDFTGLKEPGIYHIESDKGDCSACFKVEPGVYKTLKNALQKFFYFQRCGMALEEKYAGPYKRNACHQDASKILGSDERVSLPKGWHDAGDFGRYASAGAVATAHLLYSYELFPEAFTEKVNIPESGNGVPDILNECRYELEFLSEMQEEDGGVHHKVTPWVFSGFIMPEEELCEQLVFPVTSMATADFAAVMCVASRVYEKYDPDFARDCVHQAYLAGKWLMEHPDNTDFHDPEGCNTGEYTDPCDRDERMWAFAELMRTDRDVKQDGDRSFMAATSQRESREDRYRREFDAAIVSYESGHPHYDGRSVDDGFGWSDVSSLAAISVIFDPASRAGEERREKMADMLISRADELVRMQETGYPLSMRREDFVWGSNMVVSNRADVLITTALALKRSLRSDDSGAVLKDRQNIKAIELSYHTAGKRSLLTEEKRAEIEKKMTLYEKAALNQLHYILGMNAMGVSYVTGFGDHAYKDPHNRVTIADKIERPVPGEVSGGPCILIADDEIKKHADSDTPAQRCYVDHHMSYSTNEVAIYWNSSLLFAIAYFDRKP